MRGPVRFQMAAAFLLASVLPPGASAQEAPPGRSALDGLAWLAGCWRAASGDGARVSDEQWMAPRGGWMMGTSRTVLGDTVRAWERLLIREVDGRVEYVADPSGQVETVFTATIPAGVEWVFVNEGHDFPQRIVYRLAGTDSLAAHIEGIVDGELRRVDFPMVRVPCEVGG